MLKLAHIILVSPPLELRKKKRKKIDKKKSAKKSMTTKSLQQKAVAAARMSRDALYTQLEAVK